MKYQFIDHACIPCFAALCMVASLLATAGAAPPGAPSDLEQKLPMSDWTWGVQGTSDNPGVLHFGANHTGSISDTKNVRQFHWDVVNPRMVHMVIEESGDDPKMVGRQATLTFRSDGNGFDAVGFTGRHMEGMKQAQAPSSAPSSAGKSAEASAATQTAPPAPPAPPVATVPCIAVFAGDLPQAGDWALASLKTAVPPVIRTNVVSLDEGLRYEAYKTPQASLAAYVSAHEICRILLEALDERSSTLQQNRQIAGGSLTDSWLSRWDNRCELYQAAIRTNYDRFSDAVMKSGQPKVPPALGPFASLTFPPLPNAAAQETAQTAPKKKHDKGGGSTGLDKGGGSTGLDSPHLESKGGLDRKAYDHRDIWRPWWGTWTRYD